MSEVRNPLETPPNCMAKRILSTWRFLLIFGFLPLLGGVGCSGKTPKVELDSPEEAAESVGRILCAEHRSRVRAVRDELDEAIAIQNAKAEVIADQSLIAGVNGRLQSFEEAFKGEFDALESCTIVLKDLDPVHEGSKVYIAMDVKTKTWTLDDDQEISLEAKTLEVLLTLTKLDEEWKVTGSNVDFSLPKGSLGQLLD